MKWVKIVAYNNETGEDFEAIINPAHVTAVFKSDYKTEAGGELSEVLMPGGDCFLVENTPDYIAEKLIENLRANIEKGY